VVLGLEKIQHVYSSHRCYFCNYYYHHTQAIVAIFVINLIIILKPSLLFLYVYSSPLEVYAIVHCFDKKICIIIVVDDFKKIIIYHRCRCLLLFASASSLIDQDTSRTSMLLSHKLLALMNQ